MSGQGQSKLKLSGNGDESTPLVTGKKPNAIFLVFEYCEHDLARLMETMRTPFTESESKCLVIQLLQAVEFLHRRWAGPSHSGARGLR